jgi:hypothetical protein
LITVSAAGVDDERLLAGPCRVVAMDPEPLPLRLPAGLGAGSIEVLRQTVGSIGRGIGS